MSATDDAAPSAWADAVLAASIFAVDPSGTCGICVRSLHGPVRDRWLALVRGLLPPGTPLRRIPLNITDGRLLGGLDLAATLHAGRPIAERGILADADGGAVVLAMAERLAPSTVARLAAALDCGEVAVERDGIAHRSRARIGVIALDEGMADDEMPPAALIDRLAFRIDLGAVGRDEAGALPAACDIAAARARLAAAHADDEIVEALSAATMALGIASLRAPLLALRVARAHAALAGRTVVSRADAVIAGRLVLSPRATVVRAADDSRDGAGGEEQAPADTATARPDGPDEHAGEDTADKLLGDVVAEAAAAAIPPDLLAQLRLPGGGRVRSLRAGGAGVPQQSTQRGRPIGARRGDPRAGARLNVIETLRAAAPWQRIRRRDGGADPVPDRAGARVEIRRDDFRITRFKQHTETTTIFVVDASGSSALHRLAEAKGAVELLLADCYVRRDRVALIAFRGRGAEILLPPTRSLVRAKRSLASLPGGGGTPLAAGIDAAATLAQSLLRAGQTPIVVLLTDGRANIARDGEAGRARAEADALAATRILRAAAITTLLIDTSPRPQAAAERLAAGMGARYLPLPYADAAALSALIRTAADAPRP